jgi:hypothetical protein
MHTPARQGASVCLSFTALLNLCDSIAGGEGARQQLHAVVAKVVPEQTEPCARMRHLHTRTYIHFHTHAHRLWWPYRTLYVCMHRYVWG